MCRITKDGYVFEDGTRVPFDADITSLGAKEFNSLNNEPGTKWDTFILHVGLTKLDKKMDENFKALMGKMNEQNNIHFAGCPYNLEGIDKRIENKIMLMANDGLGDTIAKKIESVLKKRGIKVYRGFKGLLRDFILISAAVTAVITILKLLDSW